MIGGPLGGGPAGSAGPPGAGAPSARPSLRAAFVVFSNRAYRFLWLSSVGSFIGMQMQMIAGSWLAWELSESFAVVGLIAVAMGLPMLCFSLLGGAMADRVNKRGLSIVTQAVMCVLAFLTAALVLTDVITIELLFLVGLAQGTAFAFGMPARQPLMAAVVGPEQLMSAMALGSAAMNGTRLFGPAIAGALISWQGVGSAYFAQGVMYVIALALLFPIPAVLGAAGDEPRRGMAHEIGEGVRYVFGQRTLRLLLLMGFVPALFAMPYQMLLAGFVEGDLGQGPDAFGFLQTMTGVGALVGSIVIASLVAFPRKPLLQLALGLATGAGLVLLGVASVQWGYPGAITAVLLLGLTMTGYQTLNMTMLMHSADRAYHGRVMSIMMLTFSVVPLMAAPLGVVADVVGATNLFMAQGVIVAALLLLVSLLNPRYIFGRTEDEPLAVPAPVAEAPDPPDATEAGARPSA